MIYELVSGVGALSGMACGHLFLRSRRGRAPDPWDMAEVGPVPAAVVSSLTKRYIEREEVDGAEFEHDIDRWLAHEKRAQASYNALAVRRPSSMFPSSAGVLCQSSAAVLGKQDHYAERLHFSALPEPVYVVGQAEPVEVIQA